VNVDSDYLTMSNIDTLGTYTIKFHGEWVIGSFDCVVSTTTK
jgi:hypothetical protein